MVAESREEEEKNFADENPRSDLMVLDPSAYTRAALRITSNKRSG